MSVKSTKTVEFVPVVTTTMTTVSWVVQNITSQCIVRSSSLPKPVISMNPPAVSQQQLLNPPVSDSPSSYSSRGTDASSAATATSFASSGSVNTSTSTSAQSTASAGTDEEDEEKADDGSYGDYGAYNMD